MSHQLVEKQVLYTGKKLRLEVHHLENHEGKRLKREVCVHPGAVVVLPLLDESTVILIRNKRYAVDQILLELPAGTLEPKEPPINCAGRELLEETGYLARKLKPLAKFFTSPGILSEKMYAFVAYDLQKSHTALEEGEEIEVQPTKLSDAMAMIGTGEIADAKTIACLLMFERFGVPQSGV
ncbi:MAG TPA: NUDIX hydrolase [Tepidisphaeraceae bacterium]|jgi:ADP-ribose pyrophosphatase|nr:NUDIX hydrolase [Tepidisphaeraceae bacterium]